MLNFYITELSIIVNLGSETHTVSRDNKFADKIIEALRNRDEDSLPDLLDRAKAIPKFSSNNFTVVGGDIFFDGWRAPDVLANRIMSFMNEGLPHQPLVEFAKKLKKNPSKSVVDSLFGFMAHNGIPITESGNIICYKRVRSDFLDIHSGKFSNTVGSIVEVPRNEVVEDRNRTCAPGLHVAAWDYAKNHYGQGADDKMLEVEVDPSDFVAIPTDYNEKKARVCKYLVKAVVDVPREENLLLRSFNDEEEYDEDEYDDDYDSSQDEDDE